MQDPISVVGHTWLAFTINTSDETITKRFVAKYGYPPDRIFTHLGYRFAGPVSQATHSGDEVQSQIRTNREE